jgi:hypothetical protein
VGAGLENPPYVLEVGKVEVSGMKASFTDYLGEAFRARPFGMLVPPNWIGLGAFGLLGVLNPGFWLIGAGLEAAYLLVLSHHPRFRSVVEGKLLSAEKDRGDKEMEAILKRLDPARRERFFALRTRCEEILDQQEIAADSSIREMQAGGLGRLLGIHVRLLITQAAIERVLNESDSDEKALGKKLRELREELSREGLGSELRRSLEGQVAILQKRQKALEQGEERLAFTESELTRVEQQAALIRDEVRLAAAPEAIGSQIDRVSGELTKTSRWITEQQQLFGAEDFAEETLGVAFDTRQTR